LSEFAAALEALNPHQNPHHNPHQNPHQNPHHAFYPWYANGTGSRYDPDPIGGDDGALSPDPYDSGAPVLQRRSLRYDPATASPWPWRWIDPEWTYTGGPDALMAQALRKTQARLVGERDVRRKKSEMGLVAKPAANGEHLWRWQSEFRQQAVVGELLNHTLVIGSRVYISKREEKGKVVTLTPGLLVEIVPPEKVKNFEYDRQIDKVLRAAIEREERLPEILSQAADFRAFFYSLTGLDRAPIPRIDELIDVAWAWATHVLMMLKNNIAEYRPVQRSALVVPIIATPGHGSLPSGHATIASMTAHLLAELLYPSAGNSRPAELLRRLAARIAFNRVVAGVHFQMDSFVGRELGSRLADAFVNMASATPKGVSGSAVTVEMSSEWSEGPQAPTSPNGAAIAVPRVASLGALWEAALREVDETKVWTTRERKNESMVGSEEVQDGAGSAGLHSGRPNGGGEQPG
jgi:hypothetical protein